MSVVTAAMPAASAIAPTEVCVVSHSTLFYWWPVWFVGFVLTALTLFDGHYLIIVPKDTVALKDAAVIVTKDGKTIAYEKNDVIVLPKGHLAGVGEAIDQPHLHA